MPTKTPFTLAPVVRALFGFGSRRGVRRTALLAVLSIMALSLTALPASAEVEDVPAEQCSSGARTLSPPGARVYPEMGNGGYTSVHTDLHIAYDTATNMFLPGTRAALQQRATQCLTDFSLDFERSNTNVNGPNFAVSSVEINGSPVSFTFKQPTYPGNPNGPDDPDPQAHAISNVNPVSATNPLPPACSPSVSGNAQNGQQCPANKLVVTPDQPIPSGMTYTVTVHYSGRPGVHVDGDGSTEGWFRVNTAVAPNDGSFVTTEPVGAMAWMPLNNHPTAKPTYDVYDTVPIGKTAISAGELVGWTPGTTPGPTTVNPPDANWPNGSWTWHWHSPEPIANYLLTNSIGSYDMTASIGPKSGKALYIAIASGLTPARKTAIRAAVDTGDDLVDYLSRFAGPYPFTTGGVIVALPSVGFAEEMQTKITFGNGASSTPSQGTYTHEWFHQWFGDNVSESGFEMTYWKEGWATVGEYLLTARNSANNAGAPGTAAWNNAFDTSLNNRFNTNYNTSSTSTTTTTWNAAPSNPTVGNLFGTFNTYTRSATAYLALRQILGASASRPTTDRWIQAMKTIQTRYAGGVITRPQLEQVFHELLPNQAPGCHTRLDTFFTQWLDTPYFGQPAAGNRPQITPANFYDDNGACPRADQVISFEELPGKTYGDDAITVTASADTELPITFSTTGACSVSGTTVTITDGGTCNVTANQAGNTVWKPASLTRSFSVDRAGQTITFDGPADATYGDADIPLRATASSGLDVAYAAAGPCSIDDTAVHLTGAGTCEVTASQAGDSRYNPASDVTRSFAVAPAATTTDLTVTSSTTQYSDTVTLSAAVASGATGIQAGTVNFAIGDLSVGSAPVSDGVATLSDVPVSDAPGVHEVSAEFTSTNGDFTDSADTAPLTVVKEDAAAIYNGNPLFWTAATSATSATVTLSAVISDAEDGSRGDIRNATVTFVNRDASNAPFANCSNLSVGLINPSDTTTGLATCTTTLSTGSSGGQSYTVGTIVNSYYTRNDSSDDSIVTVAQPLTSSFITGGGFLRPTASNGLLAADAGTKNHAGFTIKFNKAGTNLQGNANVIWQSAGRVYQVKSNALATLVTAKPKATFTTKANLVDITNPAAPVIKDSGVTLQLWMTDKAAGDTLGVQVLKKGGGLWYSSSWVGARTTEMGLAGGNLAVR